MRIVLVLLALLLSVGISTAQDAPTIFRQAIDSDIENFNTVTQTLVSSYNAQSVLFPSIYDVDIDTGLPIPTGLASWTVSDDGLVYTFTIRADANWSDGTPITAQDVKFTYDAIAQPTVETLRKSFLQSISAINIIDDKTFEVVLTAPNCNIWGDLSTLVMPAHKFAADFSDFISSEFNMAPDISGGPFILDEWAPDEYLRYTANPGYWKGVPDIDTLVLQVMTDPAVVVQALLAGEVDMATVVADGVTQLEGAPNVALNVIKANAIQLLAFNFGDPANPSSAYDENGELIEQAPHPIFSDIRVRQAIAMGWDKDTALVLKPEGTSRLVGTIPSSVTWAFNDELTPWPYDPDAAAALLDEAGWVLNDAGIREKDGVPFVFELAYVAGDNASDNIALLVQDQLGQLGIQVNLLGMEAGAFIGERAVSQTFDAAIVSFSWGAPEPQVLTNFVLNSQQDILNAGLNITSYVNTDVDALLAQAGSSADCTAEARAPLYYEIQRITNEEVAYDFISDMTGYVAFSSRIQNVVTGNWGFSEIQTWTVSE